MAIDVEPAKARPWPFVVAWLALLILTGASLGTAFLGMGMWAPMAEFGITAVQTMIVYTLFMRLKGPATLKWVFAGSGFFWLLFLFGLSFTDYASRTGWPH
jgi:cytochrome c oxidase subunit IV